MDRKYSYLALIKKLVTPGSGMPVYNQYEAGFPSCELLLLENEKELFDTGVPYLRHYTAAFEQHDIKITREDGNAYQRAFDSLFEIVAKRFEDEFEDYLHHSTGEDKINYTDNLIKLRQWVERYDYYQNIERFFSRRINNICDKADPDENLSIRKDLFSYQKEYLLAHHAQKYLILLHRLAADIIFSEPKSNEIYETNGSNLLKGPQTAVVALFLSYLFSAKVEERTTKVKDLKDLIKKYGFARSANSVRDDLYKLDKPDNNINNNKDKVLLAIELLEANAKYSKALNLAKRDLYIISQ